MKEKKATITAKGASVKQWADLLIELNLMKESWRRYGPTIEIKAKNFNNIIKWGKKTPDGPRGD